MTFLSRAALAAPMALMLTALATAPVAASVAPPSDAGQPDALIRFKAYQSRFGTYPYPSPWLGGGVYDTTGRSQTQTERAAGAYERDTHLVFVVAIENAGAADRFVVSISGTGSWPVKYFNGRIDVTRAVVNGTYHTTRLGTGERDFLKVKVRLGGPGSEVMRRIVLTSVQDPTRQDAVRVKASYSSCGC